MIYKTKPYIQQKTALKRSKRKREFGLFMEMGTGKSKVIIDDMARLYRDKLITTLVIVCPNGLQLNWVMQELVDHMPLEYVAAIWSNKVGDKSHWEDVYSNEICLKVFAINIEQMPLKDGEKRIAKILKKHKCMMIVDESQRIKNAKAKRTKAIHQLGELATCRRILTGTPITQGPLDLWGQMRFLNKKILPFRTYTAFKNRYAETVMVKLPKENPDDPNEKQRMFEKILYYKNIDELRRYIDPYVYIVRKEDCLDLPDKIFENYYVDLTDQQKRMYKEMVSQALACIDDAPVGLSPEKQIMWYLTNKKVTAKNGLTKILRCQQVLGGFVKDDEGNIQVLDNNRIKVLKKITEDIPSDRKIIIWARFTAEIEAIKKMLGNRAVVYHGKTNMADRREAVERLQNDDEIRYFVSQPACGGVGLTLTAANYVIWYSLDYSLEHYLQANDRPHRIGQARKVTYIHMLCRKLLDEAILAAVNVKEEVAKEVLK